VSFEDEKSRSSDADIAGIDNILENSKSKEGESSESKEREA
jgi:hypothetical protein